MVVETVAAEGHEAIDLGTWSTDPVDYPDTARLAAEAVRGDADRAMLVCGSGAGVAVAACKFPGVRAASPTTPTPPTSASSTTTATSCAWAGA